MPKKIVIKLFTFFHIFIEKRLFFIKKINIKSIKNNEKNLCIHFINKVSRNVCVKFEVLMLK